MTVCIPSYQRAGEVLTVDFLADAFSKQEVIIGTQCEDDYRKYSRLYGGKATVIFKEGNCCSHNRNSLLEYCQQNGIEACLQLDDDIRYVRTMNGHKLTGKPFRELMEKCFDFAKRNKIDLFGSYATDNRLMMTRTVRTNFLVGMLLGIMDVSMRFDEKYLIKHDYELSLRMISQGRNVKRFNSFAPVARHKNRGGCFSAWQRKDYMIEARWLAEAYPHLVTLHPTKVGEIKFKNK